ncbi:hypothetical protein Tco_1153072 [Tanacetum coccineum]
MLNGELLNASIKQRVTIAVDGQRQEEKVDSSKALDASLVIIESNGTESQEQDTSSRSGNDAHVDDADIRPIDNEEPMAEISLTNVKSEQALKAVQFKPRSYHDQITLNTTVQARSFNDKCRAAVKITLRPRSSSSNDSLLITVQNTESRPQTAMNSQVQSCVSKTSHGGCQSEVVVFGSAVERGKRASSMLQILFVSECSNRTATSMENAHVTGVADSVPANDHVTCDMNFLPGIQELREIRRKQHLASYSEGDLLLNEAQPCPFKESHGEHKFHPNEFNPLWTLEPASDSLKHILHICVGC